MASMKVAGAGLWLICVLLTGCQGAPRPLAPEPPSDPSVPPDPREPFPSVEVLVRFRDGVSERQADSMFVAYGLSWESHFSALFAYWVEVESGDPDVHATRLGGSPIVMWVRRRANPNGLTGAVYLIVQFNNRATQESAQALIDSMPGLRVSSKVLPPQWAVTSVEAGTQRRWIAVLEKQPIVEYAMLNGLDGPYSTAGRRASAGGAPAQRPPAAVESAAGE